MKQVALESYAMAVVTTCRPVCEIVICLVYIFIYK